MPINQKFDSLTKHYALKLLEKLPKNTEGYLVCLLFSEDLRAFEKMAATKKFQLMSQDRLKDISILKKMYYNLALGAQTAFGSAEQNIGTNPFFRLGFDFQVKEKMYLGVDADVQVLIKKIEFDVVAEEIRQKAKSAAIIHFGFNFQYEKELSENWSCTGLAGLGASIITNDLRKSNCEPDNTNNNSCSIPFSTVDMTGGFTVWRKTNFNRSWGLNLSYRYVPFDLNADIKTSLQSQFSSMSILYRF